MAACRSTGSLSTRLDRGAAENRVTNATTKRVASFGTQTSRWPLRYVFAMRKWAHLGEMQMSKLRGGPLVTRPSEPSAGGYADLSEREAPQISGPVP